MNEVVSAGCDIEELVGESREVDFDECDDESIVTENRTNDEIYDELELLVKSVWYRRCYLGICWELADGTTMIVDNDKVKHLSGNVSFIKESIWNDAKARAEQFEREVGHQNLGQISDFEWGMINGKLSALRWVLGDEWDCLDT